MTLNLEVVRRLNYNIEILSRCKLSICTNDLLDGCKEGSGEKGEQNLLRYCVDLRA